jgi:hypothetical protein
VDDFLERTQLLFEEFSERVLTMAHSLATADYYAGHINYFLFDIHDVLGADFTLVFR